jgi:hypothetical protein
VTWLLGLVPGWGEAAAMGLSALSWVWNHKALTGLALSLGLVAWYRHEAYSARGALRGIEQARDEAERSLAATRVDAQRWQDASDLRDAAISALKDRIAIQNAAVEHLQFSLDRADGAAAKAEADTRAARDQFDQRIREMEEEAHAHPDQVMPLGPIVRDRIDGLWD